MLAPLADTTLSRTMEAAVTVGIPIILLGAASTMWPLSHALQIALLKHRGTQGQHPLRGLPAFPFYGWLIG